MLILSEDLFEELKSRTKVNPETGCWDWQGPLATHGSIEGSYGYIYHKNSRYTAHRVMAALRHGLNLLDRKTLVCHQCDRPCCINPDHLFLGTCFDNVQDMMRKGRSRFAKTKARLLWPKDKRKRKGVRKRVDSKFCYKGHLMDAENTKLRKRWNYVFRECRACIRDRARKYYKRQRKTDCLEHVYGSVFVNPTRMPAHS